MWKKEKKGRNKIKYVDENLYDTSKANYWVEILSEATQEKKIKIK